MEGAAYSVVVVGAGVAGLLAARELSKEFSDVLVLEASDRIGGRVQEVNGLVPWPIQAGPEFIHGGNNILARVTEEEMKCQMRELGWPDRIYLGRQKKMLLAGDEDEEIARVDKLFTEEVGDQKEPPAGQDVDGEEWLRSQGATEKMIAFAEACYANDFGASLKQLGLREMITENRLWDSGDNYLILDRSWKEMIKHLSAGLHIKCGWPVKDVRYSSGGVLLEGPHAETIAANRVVITASLKVLQSNKIRFEPALPDWKLAALHRLRMSNAIKVILTFRERFWPDGMWDVVCTDSFVPEFWMTTYPVTDHSDHLRGLCSVVCFIAGEKAENLSKNMRPEEMVTRSLQQLDDLFATVNCRAPATRALHSSYVADWAKEEYVMGAYSFPSFGAEAGDRQALAAPLEGTLFFAGEATHPAINPCMQAAMESGLRAAGEVLAEARPTASRL